MLAYYNAFGQRGWLDDVKGDVEIMFGDVRDGDRVQQAVEGCDVVFHLAALIGIPYSYEAPESYVQTNVTGTYNVANACRRHGVTPPRAYVHQRGVRLGHSRSDRRGPPATAAVALLGVEDRRRHDGAVVPSRLRAAGRGRAAVQHLRARGNRRAR